MSELAPLGAQDAVRGILVLIAIVIPVDTHAEQRAADELLAYGAYVGEEAAVFREMPAEVCRPESPEVVLGHWDEASERHVAAVVTEAAVGSVDTVVEVAWAAVVEPLKARRCPVQDATGGRHRGLTDLGVGHGVQACGACDGDGRQTRRHPQHRCSHDCVASSHASESSSSLVLPACPPPHPYRHAPRHGGG